MRPARSIGGRGPRSAAPALAAAAAVLLCVGPPAAAAAAATPHEETKAAVAIKDSGFGKVAEMAVGDTITFVNRGAKPHLAATTKAPVAFSSPKLAAGESWSYTFTKAGSYTYACRLHPEMKATVVAAAPVTKATKGDATPGGAVAEPAAATTAEKAPTEEVEVEATAAEVDTEGGRSAAIMAGSLAAVLFLGLVTAAWPGARSR